MFAPSPSFHFLRFLSRASIVYSALLFNIPSATNFFFCSAQNGLGSDWAIRPIISLLYKIMASMVSVSRGRLEVKRVSFLSGHVDSETNQKEPPEERSPGGQAAERRARLLFNRGPLLIKFRISS